MNRVKELLAEEILSWKKALANPSSDEPEEPLCREYLSTPEGRDDPCRGCPVAQYTGAPLCARAPIHEAVEDLPRPNYRQHIYQHIALLTNLYHAQQLDLPDISLNEQLRDANSAVYRTVAVIDGQSRTQKLFLREDGLTIIRAENLEAAQRLLPGSEPLTSELLKKHNLWLDVQPREESK